LAGAGVNQAAGRQLAIAALNEHQFNATKEVGLEINYEKGNDNNNNNNNNNNSVVLVRERTIPTE
jgi:hypothetical protein